ncbi:MAG TPA: hypothetical protein VGS20_08750 [Candidatus Acidoferrales bacterium]|nr:hypothetical protein [Candidatus Acidoferrales bacterium]
MTGPLARPESLNRYAYVVDNPATAADPSGNFIVSEDCILDALLPECQCDPENGCPPDLLLLLPPPDMGSGQKACDVSIKVRDATLRNDTTPPVVACDIQRAYTSSVQLLNFNGLPPPVTSLNVVLTGSPNVSFPGNKVTFLPQLVFETSFKVSHVANGLFVQSGWIMWQVFYTCGGGPHLAFKRIHVDCGTEI